VAVEADGNILIATRGKEGRIFRFSPEYELIGSRGESGKGQGEITAITGLAAMPDGRVAVTCAETELAVQIFDSSGRHLMGFGRHDMGPGNFSLPSGVTVTGDGRIWVMDEIRQVVDVFESDGSYSGRLGSGGRGPGEFLYPSAIATDGVSFIAVAEKAGNRVQLFKIRGTWTSEATEKEDTTF
jgi:hypothetical protein